MAGQYTISTVFGDPSGLLYFYTVFLNWMLDTNTNIGVRIRILLSSCAMYANMIPIVGTPLSFAFDTLHSFYPAVHAIIRTIIYTTWEFSATCFVIFLNLLQYIGVIT
jgi:hypothetical protein